MEDLIKCEKTSIVEFAQGIRIGFKPELSLASLQDRPLEPASYVAVVAGTPCVLDGTHVAANFLSIASARRIHGADLPVDDRECWPLPG